MPQATTFTLVRVAPGATANVVVSATGAIKASPGTVYAIKVLNPGTAGAFSLINATAPATLTASNVVCYLPYTALTRGQLIPLNAACNVGISCENIPTGGSIEVVYA